MTTNSTAHSMTHLDRLEAESIHIMREVVAESEQPVMLYSVGKDRQSCCTWREGVLSRDAAISAPARGHHVEVQGDV